MKLSEFANIIHGELLGDDKDFSAISTDTRTLKEGELFFALRGPNFDAHDCIDHAINAKAAGAVVSRDIKKSFPFIKVNDVHQALIHYAEHHRNKMNPKIIAVTGSCGKTTTRAMLASVFNLHGDTLWSEKSFNNDIGVPLTLLRLKENHQFAICELGANHPGEIAKLTHLVKPDIAIITNAAPAHLEGFGSLQGVACAKGEIFQGLSSNGIAIINNDDQFANFWKKLIGKHRIITFAIQHEADVKAKNIQINSHSQANFILQLPNKEEVPIQLKIMGEHNVMNALATAAAAYASHIPIETIKAGIENCDAVNKRLVIKKGLGGSTIIDDSYNANPLSVSVAMQVLKNRPGVSVLVLGDMLELGENSVQMHRELGVKARHLGIDKLYCYGKLTKNTAQSFGNDAHYFESQDDLIDALKNILNKDATVLIKGSLSMNMSRVVSEIVEE